MHIRGDIRSSNFSIVENERKIEYIIIHYTEQNFEDSIDYLCNKGVSAHYIIAKNGDVYNLVDDNKIAWHSGRSNWKNTEELNQNSIGIEIENFGDEIFPEIQMKSVIELCKGIKEKYSISRENIIGHSDVAPSRKIDPGIFFDWKLMGEEGLGIKYTEPKDIEYKAKENMSRKELTLLQTRLKKVGYKIDKTGILDKQTSNVFRAFQSHFCPNIILKNIGIESYKDLDFRYVWDETSNAILESISID